MYYAIASEQWLLQIKNKNGIYLQFCASRVFDALRTENSFIVKSHPFAVCTTMFSYSISLKETSPFAFAVM